MVIGVAETTITKVAEKLRKIEVELSGENGGFALFALIEREDSLGKWDIVVSSKWADEYNKKVLDSIASKIQETLQKDEQLMLSRIVVLPTTDAFVRIMNNFLSIEHGNVALSNSVINEIVLKEAVIITSRSTS